MDFIISVVLAIAATVVAYILIIPNYRREKLNGFFRWIHDLFNFKVLLLEHILKSLYILATFFVIIYSFCHLFTGAGFIDFLVILIGGPVALRIVFEFIMLMIVLVRNTNDINKKLK